MPSSSQPSSRSPPPEAETSAPPSSTPTTTTAATPSPTVMDAGGNSQTATQNVIRPFGYNSMECGYCKGKRAGIVGKTPKDCSKSFGLLTEKMTPEIYERFMYRGWRRSGLHLYKPCNFESCCPTLTIRLLADQYRPTKSQSKIQRKMASLLHGARRAADTARKENGHKKEKRPKGKSKGNSVAVRLESFLRQTPNADRLFDGLETATRQSLVEATVPASSIAIPASISFQVKTPSKQEEKQRQVTLVSSVCAQVAGQTKMPRDPLLKSVVSQLQSKLLSSSEDFDSFRITSIEGHLKSGQILIMLHCTSESIWEQAYYYYYYNNNNNNKNGNEMTVDPSISESEDASMRDTSRSTHTIGMVINDDIEDDNDDDRLATWYQSTMGKPLHPDQRQLRVETVPSHQSALDPQVHELYILYQHVVHQDPDPCQVTEEAEAAKNENKKGGKKRSKSHDGSCSDELSSSSSASSSSSSSINDESMSSATEGGNDAEEPAATCPTEKKSASKENDISNAPIPTIESSLPDPMEAIAALDWGPQHPAWFQQQIGPMLRQYLAPHSKPVQRVLLNNYFSFYQFLVESPFATSSSQEQQPRSHSMLQQQQHQFNKATSPNNGELPPNYGTYHQQYKIGDALIAVGVVDILPGGLSSVYLYYHPTFSHQLVALGKLAILMEIDYTLKVLRKPYYYLGYYIESCQKMRYKGDYQPSQLLCPVQYQWVDCSVAIPKLQQTPQNVCSLVDNEDSDHGSLGSKRDKKKTTTNATTTTSTPTFPDEVLSTIPMDIGANMVVTMDMLQGNGKQIVRPILQDYCFEAGKELSQKCLVKLT